MHVLQVIREAVVIDNHSLRLTYADGKVFVIDFGPVIESGGVLAPLADPDFFRRVTIGERGRYIEWPGGIDFCADALRMEGEKKQAA